MYRRARLVRVRQERPPMLRRVAMSTQMWRHGMSASAASSAHGCTCAAVQCSLASLSTPPSTMAWLRAADCGRSGRSDNRNLNRKQVAASAWQSSAFGCRVSPSLHGVTGLRGPGAH